VIKKGLVWCGEKARRSVQSASPLICRTPASIDGAQPACLTLLLLLLMMPPRLPLPLP